jgi:hypothetical protein
MIHWITVSRFKRNRYNQRLVTSQLGRVIADAKNGWPFKLPEGELRQRYYVGCKPIGHASYAEIAQVTSLLSRFRQRMKEVRFKQSIQQAIEDCPL